MINRIKNYNKIDFYMISYPKCGRTWLRSILGNYFRNIFNVIGENIFDYDIEKLNSLNSNIPFIKSDHVNSSWKKHYSQIKFPIKYIIKPKIIILRDPRDTIVSLYYHRFYRNKDYFKNISEFIREENGGIETLLNFQEELMRINGKKIIISYESLRNNSLETVSNLLNFLKIKTDKNILIKSIELNEFDKQKKKQLVNKYKMDKVIGSNDPNPNSQKVRKGLIGGYVNELNSKDIEYINMKLKGCSKLSTIYK